MGTGLTYNEVYDPVAETFSAYPQSLTQPRTGMTANQLGNGDFLLAGGAVSAFDPPLNATELFNAATESFEATGGLETARLSHTLLDGTVLVVGGQTALFGPVQFLATSEIYVPSKADLVFANGFELP